MHTVGGLVVGLGIVIIMQHEKNRRAGSMEISKQTDSFVVGNASNR